MTHTHTLLLSVTALLFIGAALAKCSAGRIALVLFTTLLIGVIASWWIK